MTPVVFGAVADDDTGATDLAGMLAGQGLRTVLVIDLPAKECFSEWTRDHDAVVIGTATRAAKPAVAYERTRAAIRLLAACRPKVFEIKYCSTFDSTPQGNIGQSIDAALDELGESFTVALPALPINGRTTYMGYHFVDQQLLSDSPMRHHPLTPMTNPNLVTHLQNQTLRKVGLLHYPVARTALERLRGQGVEIAVLDCISDADLDSVCATIADLRLITGSSAPAMRLPRIWRERRWWTPAAQSLNPPGGRGRGLLVIAGSCSEATRRQNQWLEGQGARVIDLDALRLVAAGEQDDSARVAAVAELRAGNTCLLRTASHPEDIERVWRWAVAQGKSVNQTALEIAYALASLVRRILEEQPPAGLIVAGGETAGAICRTLELGALEVGANIEPGVPLCVSLGRFRLAVVLKSGNFGNEDFYGRARAACEVLSC